MILKSCSQKVTAIVFLTFFLTPFFTCQGQEKSAGNCWERPEILQAKKNDVFYQYLQLLKQNGRPGPYNVTDKVYIADINNDGVDEYMLEEYEGSGSFLYLWPYQKRGNAFEAIDMPMPEDFPKGSRGSRGYGLFIRLCGKVYLDFDYGSYIWEGGKIVPACDQDWMRYSHGRFQKLYDENKFQDAYKYLSDDLEQCKKFAPSPNQL